MKKNQKGGKVKMDDLVTQISTVNDPRNLFVLCGIFIFADIISGYLKAIKYRKVNSSISRDGYIKKISWLFALILGFIIDFFIGTKMFLLGSALMCIATEGISVYENLGELGVHLPFAKYFEKLKTE